MKIIPIFFYHEKWVVIMRKFVYSPDGVEKMGPLRGDGTPGYCAVAYLRLPCREETPFEGTETNSNTNISIYYKRVEKMGPPRGDGNLKYAIFCKYIISREDWFPSWGRKPILNKVPFSVDFVEKMAPPSWGREHRPRQSINFHFSVEKMGPLRGNGNFCLLVHMILGPGREDGSPSWERKLYYFHVTIYTY